MKWIEVVELRQRPSTTDKTATGLNALTATDEVCRPRRQLLIYHG
jgi:hypothetical protein